MRYAAFVLTVLLTGGTATALIAQENGGPTPTVTVSAEGSAAVPADYAILTLGVLVQDSTPTLAAARMDAQIRSVTDTLRSMGFPAESLPTAHYNVTPNRGRDGETITGYTASTAVSVNVWDIAITPALIEATLAAGATDVSGLQFGASDEREARDEALRRAYASAKRDAEVVAAAADGHLGVLLDVSTQPSGMWQARSFEFAAAGGGLPQITPRNITVVASVTVRWQFVEN